MARARYGGGPSRVGGRTRYGGGAQQVGGQSRYSGVTRPKVVPEAAPEEKPSVWEALSHIPLVFGAAIPMALAHPVRTTEQFGQGIKGLAELAASIPADPRKWSMAGLERTGGAMWEATAQDVLKRYGNDWWKYAQEEPLANLSDLLLMAGTATRASALGGAAVRLDPQAARIATMLAHPRAVWKESGRFDPRVLEYTTPEGTTLRSTQQPSRSPLRAQTQLKVLDPISRRFPDAPAFGSLARITRAQANQIERSVRRALASLPDMEAIGRLNADESARVYWGAQMGDYSAGELQRLRDAVANHYDKPLPDDDPRLGELLHRAKQAGWGPGLLTSIDDAIRHAAHYPNLAKVPKLQKAIGALEHATKFTEETLLDNAGFSGIENEIRMAEEALGRVKTPEATARLTKKLAALQAQHGAMRANHMSMFDKSRGRLLDWVDGNTAVDAPERTAWRAALLQAWRDPAKVDAAVAATDRMAVRFDRYNPGSWWRDRVGMPSNEGARQFVDRVEALPQEERNQLFQYTLGGFGGEEAHLFKHPLREAIDEMPLGKGMQVGQFRKLLRDHGVTPEDLFHSGFEDWLSTMSHNDIVTPAEARVVYDSPDNAFNLVEHLWRNTEGTEPPYATTIPGINSRYLQPGSYYHLAVGLSPSGGVRYGVHRLTNEEALSKDEQAFIQFPEGDVLTPTKGFTHNRGRFNVIAHIRFHVFDDADGKRKLLIEEFQSDWAKDVKAQAKELPSPIKERALPSGETRDAMEDLLVRVDRVNADIERALTAGKEAQRRWNEGEGPGTHWYDER
jgi:hypothetical protein